MVRKSGKLEEFIFTKWKKEKKSGRREGNRKNYEKKMEGEEQCKRERDYRENIKKSGRGTVRERESYTN